MASKLLSAHAGGPEGLLRPNTIQAIQAAKDTGVDLIEFDVRVTRDNKFVLHHDDTVRVRNKTVKINKLTYDELRMYSKDVCLLEDVLMLIRDHAMAHVDIKTHTKTLDIVDLCVSVLGEKSFVITTTDTRVVKRIRKQRPNINVALTIGQDISGMSLMNKMQVRLAEYFPFLLIARCDPTSLAICYKAAMPWTLEYAQFRHMPVLLWTLDDEAIVQKAWQDKRVWAFTTNYPRRALTLRHPK